MAPPLSKPSKRLIVLVLFQWEGADGPEYAAFARSMDDRAFGTFLYVAAPNMRIDPYTDNGALSEKDPLEIYMPRLTGGFAERISNGEPHAPIDVTVTELWLLTDAELESRVAFRGQVDDAVRNPSGRRNLVRIECVSEKEELDVPIGILATNECTHAFGDAGCKKDVDALEETATIDSIDGNAVTLSGLSSVDDFYWNWGSIRRGGLRIRIRNWESGTVFELDKRPPAEWAGQTAIVRPGCERSTERCTFWGQINEFRGTGHSMPAYNPLYEDPYS